MMTEITVRIVARIPKMILMMVSVETTLSRCSSAENKAEVSTPDKQKMNTAIFYNIFHFQRTLLTWHCFQ